LKHSIYLLLLTPLLGFAQSPDGSFLFPLNQELPSGVHLAGEFRARGEAYQGGGYNPFNKQGYLLSRFQLNFEARYSWFKVFAQTQDSRVFGDGSDARNWPSATNGF
jgi:hypothetical protein